MKRHFFSLSLLFISILYPMENASPKIRIREMATLDLAQNMHQAKSFVEAYISGTIAIDVNNSVVFADLEKEGIYYSLPHSQAMRVINMLVEHKEQILDEDRHKGAQWLENPFNDFTSDHIKTIQETRFILFDQNLDLDFVSYQTKKDSLKASIQKIIDNRKQYKDAFEKANKAALETACKQVLHLNGFTPLSSHIAFIHLNAREAALKIMNEKKK